MQQTLKNLSLFSHEKEELQAVDLRISGSWMVAGLVAAATVTTLAALFLSGTALSTGLQNLALVQFFLVGTATLMSLWRSQPGMLYGLVTGVVSILLGWYWLQKADLILLLAAVTLLAGALVSLRTALFFSIAETLVVVLLLNLGLPARTASLAILLVWSAFLLMVVVYRPVYRAAHWYRTSYNQMQAELRSLRAEREDRAQMIADLDNANRQMNALFDKTNALRQIAEDAEKYKATFVAMVSHEFRTPLSMIIGLSGLMTRDPSLYGTALPEDLVADLAVINRNCEHLARLVNDVLDLTHAETGQLSIHKDWVDLLPEIDDAVFEVRPLLEKKNLVFHRSVPAEIPLVYCDRVRIRQVILNLVSNAARYTERGSIDLSVEVDPAQAIFHISDTGPGILSSERERIFEPFTRGQNRPAGETGGSGLGLSICRKFIELHGGQIWVESELGRGSTFSFKIPIHPQEAPHVSPARWISQEKIWRDRKPRLTASDSPLRRRILVVDAGGDLVQWLRRQTSEVDFVPSGSPADGIEQGKRNPVQAIVVNGTSLADALACVDEVRTELFDTPVLGCVFASNQEYFDRLGIYTYLIKPILLETLQDILQTLPQKPQRIFIVDDDPDLRQVLARMLTSLNPNCQVLQAGSGEEALELLPTAEPDLVMLDIVMGGIDGWAVLEEKNRQPGLKEVPVIILSGQDPGNVRNVTPVILSAYGNGLPVNRLLDTTLAFSEIVSGQLGLNPVGDGTS